MDNKEALQATIHVGDEEINLQDTSYQADPPQNQGNKVELEEEERKESQHSQNTSKTSEPIQQLIEQVRTRIQKVKDEKKTKDEMVPYTKILLTYADGTDKLMIFIGYIAAIGTGFSLPSFQYLFGDITNKFTLSTADSLLDSMSLMALNLTIIGAVLWLTSYLYYVLLVIVAERITKKIRVAYLRSVLQQEIGWFDKNNATELPSRISKETQAIQNALGEKIGQMLITVSTSIAGFFFAFLRGWLMPLILLGVFPLVFYMMTRIMKAMQSGVADNLIAYGQSAGYAEQALNAIKVVQAFGQEKTEVSNYEKHLDRARKQGIRTHMKSALAIGSYMSVIFMFYAYGYYTGSWLITKQVKNSNSGLLYNIGDVLSCQFGIVFGVMSMGRSTAQMKAIIEGRVAGKMAYDIIQRKPEIPLEHPNAIIPSEIKGRIEFKNVTFTYTTRKDQKVLDDFSAVFEEGKTTAIVGASGSGKSTIVQLIERFYDPDSGTVLIDNIDLKQLNLRNFRREVGLVSQEPALLNCTIKQNMLYVKPKATDEEILQALKLSNAWEFVSGLDQGINTNVGNAGGQLSGGQKQRIAISRAFIKKPKILLLDEATSALDKRKEKEVQAAIDSIKKELGSITTIVIAHRLSTIRNADNIIVMNKGKIVENGTHEALLETYPDGIYAKFVKEQQKAEEQNNQNEEQSPLKENLEAQGDELDHKGNTIKKTKNDELYLKEQEMREEADSLDKTREEQQQVIKKSHNRRNNMKRMIAMTDQKAYIGLGLLLTLIAGSIMPSYGIIFVNVLFNLSGINYERIRQQADFYCLMLTVLGVVSAFSIFGSKFIFGFLGDNVTLKVRRLLYTRILQKHIGYFDEKDNAPGNLTNTMTNDSQTINGVSAEGLASQIEAFWALIIGVALGFIFCWQEALVCLVCVPFIMVSAVMAVKFQQGISKSSDQASKEANILCSDAIQNYKTIASFGYEEQIIQDYQKLLDGPIRVAVKDSHLVGLIFGFSNFVKFTVFATLFYFAALFINKGWIKVSEFNINGMQSTWLAIFCVMFGAQASGSAQSFGPDLGRAKQAAAKIFAIIDLPSEINAMEPSSKVERVSQTNFKGEIKFKDVWFRYPTRKNEWILKGLNMRINLNETVALVGQSGCGKSTIVSLILRFYDVNFGQILIDGINIKDYNLHEYRKMIGLVQQEPILFNYTISENILYGHSEATNSEIKQAAEIANATEFIESKQILHNQNDSAETLFREFKNNENQVKEIIGSKQYTQFLGHLDDLHKQEIAKGVFASEEGDVDRRNPEQKDVALSHGYHISCGIKGSKISGGQKQRIAIARAIIRKPKILILDEATSALDEESQRKVQVALDRIMVDRTSIVIAHRLSTVEKCDRILVLEEGRLVEEGGFNELKQREGGKFANLVNGMKSAKSEE